MTTRAHAGTPERNGGRREIRVLERLEVTPTHAGFSEGTPGGAVGEPVPPERRLAATGRS